MFKKSISLSAIQCGLFLFAVLLSIPYSVGADVREAPAYKEAIEKFEGEDWQGAHRLFKRLQESYPDNPIILNNLAVIAVKLNQLDLAIRLLEHAILSHPTLSVSYNNLKSLYNHQAVREYKMALSLDSLELTAPKLNIIGASKQAADSATKAPIAAELVLAEKVIEKSLVEEARPTLPDTDREQITNNLKRWVQAWIDQDLEAYFDSYIENYRPRSGTAHRRWRKLREDRIIQPQFINIRILNLSIEKQDDNNATLTFKQHYQSNLLNSMVIKEIKFYKTAKGWKIKSERVVNPP